MGANTTKMLVRGMEAVKHSNEYMRDALTPLNQQVYLVQAYQEMIRGTLSADTEVRDRSHELLYQEAERLNRVVMDMKVGEDDG